MIIKSFGSDASPVRIAQVDAKSINQPPPPNKNTIIKHSNLSVLQPRRHPAMTSFFFLFPPVIIGMLTDGEFVAQGTTATEQFQVGEA